MWIFTQNLDRLKVAQLALRSLIEKIHAINPKDEDITKFSNYLLKLNDIAENSRDWDNVFSKIPTDKKKSIFDSLEEFISASETFKGVLALDVFISICDTVRDLSDPDKLKSIIQEALSTKR
ncbi:hypothetical protein [Aeromonas veronii]|uniref:hypothetical protein n=1 Tax=Aeromonas veronii TaxID=654 RepID=UPI003BA01BE0